MRERTSIGWAVARLVDGTRTVRWELAYADRAVAEADLARWLLDVPGACADPHWTEPVLMRGSGDWDPILSPWMRLPTGGATFGEARA